MTQVTLTDKKVSNLVFILDNLDDTQTLLSGVPEESEVYLLDASGDALAQMASILKGYSGIDAIHLFSHGSSGMLDLGTTRLHVNNLDEYANTLAQIGASLGDNGDILLYGCNVADGQVGVEFVQSLADVTGADVAASNNFTGSSDLGGDWILETQSGSVESESISNESTVGILLCRVLTLVRTVQVYLSEVITSSWALEQIPPSVNLVQIPHLQIFSEDKAVIPE